MKIQGTMSRENSGNLIAVSFDKLCQSVSEGIDDTELRVSFTVKSAEGTGGITDEQAVIAVVIESTLTGYG